MASSRGPSVQQNKVRNVASVICAGDQQYRLDDSVFVVWGNETGIRRRWYAAYIVGHVKNKSLRIKWGEGGVEAVVEPQEVIRARHVLKPDTKVHVHDPEVHVNDYYQEVCLIRGLGHGRYEVRGRRGRIFSVSFREMMLDNMTVEIHQRKRKGIPLPPTWMQDYPDIWFTRPDLFLSDHVFIFTTPPSSKKFATFDAEDWEKARDALLKIIPRRGGRVVHKMEEMLEVQSPRFRFLLAPVPCRTAKYLQALAANIPCVSPRWVFKMYREQQYFDDFNRYRLPTTASIDQETKEEVPWVERIILFDNLRVGLIGEDEEFISTWTLAITMGMGLPTRVLDLDNSCFDMENFDVIVVRGTISGMLRAEFAENHVPVVNEEWLVQSLVYGRKQDARDKRFECSVRKENGRKRSVEWNDPERVASRLKDRYRALYS